MPQKRYEQEVEGFAMGVFGWILSVPALVCLPVLLLVLQLLLLLLLLLLLAAAVAIVVVVVLVVAERVKTLARSRSALKRSSTLPISDPEAVVECHTKLVVSTPGMLTHHRWATLWPRWHRAPTGPGHGAGVHSPPCVFSFVCLFFCSSAPPVV